MDHIAIALVEPVETSDDFFARYLEESGIGVTRLATDRTLLKTLELKDVSVVVARPGAEETDTLRLATTACKRLDKPLILVAREGSDVERIMYLKMGADDVLTPPFSMEELLLRIKALARRSVPSMRSTRCTWILNAEELSLDKEKHYATINGEPLRLTEAQWNILCCLSESGDAAVSRRLLRERCLSYADDIYDRAVDTHIKNLRRTLGGGGWIETVRGYGYRFSWEARRA